MLSRPPRAMAASNSAATEAARIVLEQRLDLGPLNRSLTPSLQIR